MSLRDELASDLLRAEIDALEIDRRDLVKDGVIEFILPVRILRIDEETRDVDARIVDEDIDRAEPLLCRGDHRLDTRTLRDIGDNIEDLAVLCLERGRLRIHIADDDVRPLLQEFLRDGLSDARRTARDDRCFSFEIQPTHIGFSFLHCCIIC